MGEEDWLGRGLRGGRARAKALGWVFKGEGGSRVSAAANEEGAHPRSLLGHIPQGTINHGGFEVSLIAMRSCCSF